MAEICTRDEWCVCIYEGAQVGEKGVCAGGFGKAS